MSNEVRQAWQRFYAAALTGLTAHHGSTFYAHSVAVEMADAGTKHYATLIPAKAPTK